jgi:hypothetical protein
MANLSVIAGQSSGNLNFSTAQKMIHRLLTHDRIKTDLDEGRIRGLGLSNDKPEVKAGAFTKEELAEKLSISPEDLEKLESSDLYESIANKVSLPLIRLYCATKFADGESKRE